MPPAARFSPVVTADVVAGLLLRAVTGPQRLAVFSAGLLAGIVVLEMEPCSPPEPLPGGSAARFALRCGPRLFLVSVEKETDGT